MKNYIRDVIDRYINHDYPKEVDQDFRTWLTDEERADEKDHELNQLWEATESATTSGYRHSLERMRELTGIGTRRRIHSLRTHLVVWRVAAALLIAFSSVSIYLALQNRQAPDLLQAYIPTAEMRNITLPDGTQVLINSQSTLLYPQQFKGDTRCVYLVGEAGFKVKRDEEHPFIVKSSDFQVHCIVKRQIHHSYQIFNIFFHSFPDPLKHDSHKTIFIEVCNKFLILFCDIQTLAFFFHHTHDQIIG